MPAILRHLPAVRLARYRRAHPEVNVIGPPWPGDGAWRAVIPLGGNSERVLAGPGLEDLLDKLDRAAEGG